MIHVACGANTAYLPYVSSMLHSLLVQDNEDDLTIHFMHGPAMQEADLQRLGGMVAGLGATWRPHTVEQDMLRHFPGNWRFGLEAWYRVLLPELLPEVDRIIYLDADTLVLSPIKPLWDVELGQCIVGAVHNPMYPFLSADFVHELGLESPAEYFNSGVLLMDLDAWRGAGLSQQLYEFVAEHGEDQQWPDQNALNAVLRGGRTLLLDPAWNVQNVYFDVRAAQLPLSSKQLASIRRQPRIVHFVAPYKPLDYLCKHPYQREFLRHLAATPWAGSQPVGKTPVNRVLRLLPQPAMWVLLLVKLPRTLRRLRGQLSAPP